MRSRSIPPLALALAALLLPACGGEEPKSKGGGGADGGSRSAGGPVLGKKLPEYTPSGVKEDFRKVTELKNSSKHAKTEDDRKAAQKALADLLAELPAKWEGKEVPAPEGCYYAIILDECGKWPEAIVQCRRYLDVAPEDSANYAKTTRLLIDCLASASDYDGAAEELSKAADGVFKNRDPEQVAAGTGIAVAMMKAGLLEKAGARFETLINLGPGDPESAIYAVDCYLRCGLVDRAVNAAAKGAETFKDGQQGERMKRLVQQVAMIGKPAPDFAAVRTWVGDAGPVSRETMAGKVTVVFFWNMQKQWNKWFFERLNRMYADLAPKGLILVGCSRLARFDARKMGTRPDMTEEEEVGQVEAYSKQENIKFNLGIGNYDPDTSLLDAWSGHVVPSYVVVGKDGNVCYVRSGKEEEHIAALKEEIEKALAK